MRPVVFLDRKDLHDIGMIDFRKGTGLTQDTILQAVVARRPQLEQLDRHFATKLEVARAMNLTKRPLADALE